MSTELYEKFLLRMSDLFEVVFVLAGNHEFYVQKTTKYSDNAKELLLERTVPKIKEKIEKICSQKPNLHFLDKKSIEIDGVRFIGTTLWSFVPQEHQLGVEMRLNDYRASFVVYEPEKDDEKPTFLQSIKSLFKKNEDTKISEEKKTEKLPYRNMRVTDTVAWHEDELAFIKSEVKIAKDKNQKAVVLTHHSPSMTGTSDPRFEGQPTNHAFSSDLDGLISSKLFKGTVFAWCFGHTHFNNPHLIGEVQLVSNQRGYTHVKEEVGKPYEAGFVLRVPKV
eukprot:TRINITY_DN6532_c0_g2_i1.p1 TRINITY_DN6532_c0_g2~~TRINITY_DN6532_c0_g2_i1.p1  ORF type:complete len:317 (-),score=88.43 TRINITY_DN6532_c0_g2_i1:234-1070(-)